MYDHLCGEIIQVNPTRVVIRAGGVGYALKVPVTTSNGLTAGQETLLYTILHVVDGQPSLLAFRDRSERDLASKMMTVSGVGPSTALAILSMYSATMVVDALRAGNHQLLQKAKGIGAKTAERLCLELKDHAQEIGLGTAEPTMVVPLSRFQGSVRNGHTALASPSRHRSSLQSGSRRTCQTNSAWQRHTSRE